MYENNKNPEIIFVCIGNFQQYIVHNIQNLKDCGNTNITVIVNKEIKHNLDAVKGIKIVLTEDLDNANFDKVSRMNRTMVNGLFFQASNRFFYLYDYIRKHNITNCFHIENDVMVYCNLCNCIPTAKKIYLTMEN